MALAVIGDLVFSTVQSLIFVPAMFVMMDDLGQLALRQEAARVRWRGRTPRRASAGRATRARTQVDVGMVF
jgi:hypothetical protein